MGVLFALLYINSLGITMSHLEGKILYILIVHSIIALALGSLLVRNRDHFTSTLNSKSHLLQLIQTNAVKKSQL